MHVQLRVLRSRQFRARPPKFGRETYFGFFDFRTVDERLNPHCRLEDGLNADKTETRGGAWGGHRRAANKKELIRGKEIALNGH